MTTATTPRSALLAGATGLIGSALLPELCASHDPVHLLLRRAAPGVTATACATRVKTHLVDFAALPTLPPVDDVFICLGTTIAQAGSKEAFRAVDFDAVLAVARAARAAGATRLAVVSSLGADSRSGVFYNRVKGEMEAAMAALGYEQLVIVRPSLLLGDRAVLGQPRRAGEQWMQRLLKPLGALVPASVRPIEAATVARAMLRVVRDGTPGLHSLPSSQLQQLGR